MFSKLAERRKFKDSNINLDKINKDLKNPTPIKRMSESAKKIIRLFSPKN